MLFQRFSCCFYYIWEEGKLYSLLFCAYFFFFPCFPEPCYISVMHCGYRNSCQVGFNKVFCNSFSYPFQFPPCNLAVIFSFSCFFNRLPDVFLTYSSAVACRDNIFQLNIELFCKHSYFRGGPYSFL